MTQDKTMFRELKKAIRLVPYSVKWKWQVVAAAIFIVVSVFQIVIAAMANISLNMIAGTYIALVPMFLGQIFMMLTYSDLIQSSRHKHQLQCSLYATGYLYCMLIVYTAMMLFCLILYGMGFLDKVIIAQFVIPLIIASLLLSWLYPLIYKVNMKLYILLLAVMIGVFAGGLQSVILSERGILFFERVSRWPVMVLLLMPYPVCVFVTGIVYTVSNKLYRRTVSEFYIDQAFKQASR